MITIRQAIDYTRIKLDEWGYEIQIECAEAYLDAYCKGDVLIDVEFYIDGTHHVMTVWSEADGRIYGEW